MSKIIDIYSKSEGAAGELSNFTAHKFIFDGVECASMEGFLQSLKYVCPKKQEKICLLTGKAAKDAGAKKRLWKLTRTVHWRGKHYGRLSPEYRALIFRAYREMYAQNEAFRKALDKTRGAKLRHSIGGQNPKKTILTEREFICMLYRTGRSGR
ncbi:MAG: hypothetical protein IJW21_09695 [Clostridia bacterium]|nr:hypothetical protein [Clostridia bacterium]